jgi:hypothetical protein
MGSIGVPALLIIFIGFWVFFIVTMWKVFEKAGQPGWAAIVPFYNFYVLLKIVGRPGWWLALMFIPIANIVVGIIVLIDFAKAFGKSGGFAALLILLPFVGWPMLAFGQARYLGPVADPAFQAGGYGRPSYRYAAYVPSGHSQLGYPQPGYAPQGHPAPGQPSQGFPQQGYPQQGQPQGYPQQPGYPQPGQPQQGQPEHRGHPQQPGYPPQGYPQQQPPGYPPQPGQYPPR